MKIIRGTSLDDAEVIHATAVRIATKALLICGPSGSGKSTLALQLIEKFGAELIADDAVDLTVNAGMLEVTCPPTIQGKIESRGEGILELPAVAEPVPVGLVISLEDDIQQITIRGVAVPAFRVNAKSDVAAHDAHAAFVAKAGLAPGDFWQGASKTIGGQRIFLNLARALARHAAREDDKAERALARQARADKLSEHGTHQPE